MQFQLPNQLSLECIKYDATRKKLADPAKPAQKKSPYPKGNIVSLGIIPTDVCPLRKQQEVIDYINQAPASKSVVRLTKPDGVLGEVKIYGIVYHYKHFWVAAWLPNRKDDGYHYGITVAFKDNATARKTFHGSMFRSDKTLGAALIPDISHMRSKRIGRTDWCVTTQFITQDLINEGYTSDYFIDPDGNHRAFSCGRGSSEAIRRKQTSEGLLHVCAFRDQLFADIPQWHNRHRQHWNLWKRTTPEGSTIYACLREMRLNQFFNGLKFEDWQHTPDFYLNRYQKHDTYRKVPQDLLTSKWFRQKVTMACTQSAAAFNTADPMKADMQPIYQPFARICRFLSSVIQLTSLYPDINLDLIKSRYDELLEVDFNFCRYPQGKLGRQWVREHIKPESMLNMIERYRSEEIERVTDRSNSGTISSFYTGDDTNTWHFYLRNIDDALSMLNQVLIYNKKNEQDQTKPQLNPMPRRWRHQEWHDHLMAETWKISNPKVDLPQKLFPQPVKANGFTFIQPHDTHQLAQWGKAVRNCVGSSSYAEGIKKFKHLIVLAMLEGKPRYTIQLKIDNGMMHVVQIADVANKRLDDQQRSQVEQAFSAALQTREKQLA
jgi:hypothetical protein